jgi:hypothetical protein
MAMSATLSRSARGEINRLPCVFAVALKQRCAVCSLAQQDAEQLLCTQPLARAACAALHGSLRDKSRFVLGLRADPRSTRATAGDELRLQCGGLVGLRNVLDQSAMSVDVQRLLERLQERNVDHVPWEPVLRTIGEWPSGK